MKLNILYDNKNVEYKKNKKFFIGDENLRVPEKGTWGFVLHDWQMKEFDYKPRQYLPDYEQMKPMPSTRQLWGRYPFIKKDNGAFDFQIGKVYDRVTFSKEWQFWLKELLEKTLRGTVPYGKKEYFFDRINGKEIKVPEHPYAHLKCTDGSLLEAYTSLVTDHRSFTDTTAPENGYTDYVTSRNLQKNNPYKVKPLMTTGNIVKIEGEWRDYYVIKALDLLKSPPSIEDAYFNNLIMWSTEQTVTELPKLNNKRRWVVSRYPQLKVVSRLNNLEEVGTPFGVFSMGGYNLISKDHVSIIQNNSIYSPYVPER